MKRASDILQNTLFAEIDGEQPAPAKEDQAAQKPPTPLSKRQLKKVAAAINARQARDEHTQDIGFNARPFTVTNLPVRPKPGLQVWERRNGNHYLRIEAAAGKMLPYGQDRLVLLLLATTACHQKTRVLDLGSASDILRLFGKSDAGLNFERLAQSFHRIMAASITWGTNGKKEGSRLIEESRMLLLDHFRLWAGDRSNGPTNPNQGYRNVVTLSQQFFDELQAHPIPVDMVVVRALLDSPAALDFYVWVAYRAHRIPPGDEIAVPLFGEHGLQSQLGSDCKGDRKFRQQVREWIQRSTAYWPECPVRLSEDGKDLLMIRGIAVHPKLRA
jgi:hypothetical protein